MGSGADEYWSARAHRLNEERIKRNIYLVVKCLLKNTPTPEIINRRRRIFDLLFAFGVIDEVSTKRGKLVGVKINGVQHGEAWNQKS